MARWAIFGTLLAILIASALKLRVRSVPVPPPRGPEAVGYLVEGNITVWYPATRRDQLPLLLFSPAMDNSPQHYTVLNKDLASFGYIVAGVQPSSSAPLDLQHREALQPEVDRWMAELQSALASLKTDPLLANHIDSSRIGVFGHSFGGAVALHLLATDSNFQRAANLDGAPQGQPRHLDRPALFIVGAPLAFQRKLNGQILEEIESICRSDSAGCRLEDHPAAGHMNFSDTALSTPHIPFLRNHRELTDIDDIAFLHSVSDSLRDFFDQM